MADPIADGLQAVLVEVLADAAFVLADPADPPPPLAAPAVGAAISFEADRRGRLRLLTGRGTATELAANMLALDPGDPDAAAHAGSAVSELLNVMAGVLVARLFGPDHPSTLGLPEPVAGPAGPLVGPALAAVRTEAGDPILLQLELLDEDGGNER